MILEFIHDNGFFIVNGVLLGTLFSRISTLKDSIEWKEKMLKMDVDSIKKNDLHFLENRVERYLTEMRLIEQRHTMEIDYLKKEIEELKKAAK